MPYTKKLYHYAAPIRKQNEVAPIIFSAKQGILTSDMRKAICFITVIICLSMLALPVATASAEERTMLPVLMYHSISESKKGVYFISPRALESDLAALSALGYVFVTANAVKDYLNGTGELPEKPLLLTFDDGHYDNLFYGLEILKKHDAHAVINVIGCFSEYSSTHEKDHPEYSHLTWDEIAYLAKSGVFEIGSHTYGMHAYKPRFGIKRKKGESEEDHRRALSEDLEILDRILLDKCGVRPVAFAYPFGAYDEESEKVVKSRYDMIFTCYERVNSLKKGDSAKLSRIYRINRDGTLDTQTFLARHGIR